MNVHSYAELNKIDFQGVSIVPASNRPFLKQKMCAIGHDHWHRENCIRTFWDASHYLILNAASSSTAMNLTMYITLIGNAYSAI